MGNGAVDVASRGRAEVVLSLQLPFALLSADPHDGRPPIPADGRGFANTLLTRASSRGRCLRVITAANLWHVVADGGTGGVKRTARHQTKSPRRIYSARTFVKASVRNRAGPAVILGPASFLAQAGLSDLRDLRSFHCFLASRCDTSSSCRHATAAGMRRTPRCAASRSLCATRLAGATAALRQIAECRRRRNAPASRARRSPSTGSVSLCLASARRCRSRYPFVSASRCRSSALRS